ncbi:MAG: patatin-like phospholipase family protein, partial [Gammaproteobacteria bacterium]|nr:patatin-like phospholipase family protein [Gammaproteobacteria bacterium]
MNIRVSFFLIIFSFILFLSGCASLPREPVPIKHINNAEVIGIPNVRSWAGEVTEHFQQDIIKSAEQERQHSLSRDEQGIPQYAVLSLSGGGADGAYGAGFLNGWTRAGTRPEFKIVSGISTGALIAPFAFLGTDYDDALKKVFTTVNTEKILERLSIISLFSSEAMTNTGPFKRLLEQYVTDDMIRQVASVHDQGRRLYIGTANMDAQRPVVWN